MKVHKLAFKIFLTLLILFVATAIVYWWFSAHSDNKYAYFDGRIVVSEPDGSKEKVGMILRFFGWSAFVFLVISLIAYIWEEKF
jgi:hypothetical protein